MLPTVIRQQLSALRQRERLLRLVWGLARLLAVIVGLIVLVCLIDYVVDELSGEDTPFAVHLTLLIGLIAGSILTGVFFFWSLSKRLDDDELSLWVEDKTPTLQHRLISAVQFNQQGAEFTGMSAELVGVVTLEAEQHVRKVPVARVADHRRLKKSALTLGPAVLVALLPMLIWPGFWDALLKRLVLIDVPLPRRVVIENVSQAVQPKGDNVIVKVKAMGALPGDRARLRYTLNDVTDEKDLEIVKETLYVKLELLGTKMAELQTGLGAVRDEMNAARWTYVSFLAAKKQRQEAGGKANEAVKQEGLESEPATWNKREKEANLAHERFKELSKLWFAKQESLKQEAEEYRLELTRFLGPRASQHVDTAALKLAQSIELLDRDNEEATLAEAGKRLAEARTAFDDSPVGLMVGDVVIVHLPVPASDCSWSVSADKVLVPDGEAAVRAESWSQRFKAAQPGKSSLEISYRGDPLRKPFKLEAQVQTREYTYYKAEVKAVGDNLRFKAYIGDGRMKNNAEITFVAPPVADITAYTIMPDYCPLTALGVRDEMQQTRNEVTGIPGSAVRIEARISGKVKSATLHLFEIENAKSEDPWKTREKSAKPTPMTLFPAEKQEMKLIDQDREWLGLGTAFYKADGERIWSEGLANSGFKVGARVNFAAAPANPVQRTPARLLRVRLLEADAKANPEIDGPYEGTIAAVDAHARTLTVAGARGPTIAIASFDLHARMSSYSVEVVDNNGFKNNPIPKHTMKEVPEARTDVWLLREEIPDQKKMYLKLTGKTQSTSQDRSGIFEGMPVPLGGRIPIAYKFSSSFGVGEAKLKFRILRKRLSGNESQISHTLGIALDDADDGAAKVREVLAGSTAEKAGLKVDDLITHLQNVKIQGVEPFVKTVKKIPSGKVLMLSVKREDPMQKEQLLTLPVMVGDLPDEDYQSLPLQEYFVDPYNPKGRFELERGCFEDMEGNESVFFYPRPPFPRKDGGGRFLFETKNLGGKERLKDGDQIEFYIEVYPAMKTNWWRRRIDKPDWITKVLPNRLTGQSDLAVYPAANPGADPILRPIGRSEPRKKFFASGLADRLLDANAEQQMIRNLENRQRLVFGTPVLPDPKEEEKKKGP